MYMMPTLWLSVCDLFFEILLVQISLFLSYYLVPDTTSELFQQLIESLLITHAECKLNDIGHLVYDNADPNRTLPGSWCANLTRRPLSSF